jgi:isopentenyl diphosphate isomerase/L-lactate dehydrogenase-like FMN-dependent dehydrogenase
MADAKQKARREVRKVQTDYEQQAADAREARRKGFERAHKAGLSLREIAEEVELHWTTVGGILKGK